MWSFLNPAFQVLHGCLYPFSTTLFWGCPWVANEGSPSLGVHTKVKATDLPWVSLNPLGIGSEGVEVSTWASLEEVSIWFKAVERRSCSK